jgi:hypothetical protein
MYKVYLCVQLVFKPIAFETYLVIPSPISGFKLVLICPEEVKVSATDGVENPFIDAKDFFTIGCLMDRQLGRQDCAKVVALYGDEHCFQNIF